MNGYVWVAYSKDPPYLPVAVAETSKDLAEKVGTTKNVVDSAWSHYKKGFTKTCRFHRVKIDEDEG